MRYIVIEVPTEHSGDPAEGGPACFHVAELVRPAAPLGPWAAHYRRLHARPLRWEQAENAVIALNRGDRAQAEAIWDGG